MVITMAKKTSKIDWNNPEEVRAYRRDYQRAYRQKPENKAKANAASNAYCQKPEAKAKAKARYNARILDPKYHEKLIEDKRNYKWAPPEVHVKNRKKFLNLLEPLMEKYKITKDQLCEITNRKMCTINWWFNLLGLPANSVLEKLEKFFLKTYNEKVEFPRGVVVPTKSKAKRIDRPNI